MLLATLVLAACDDGAASRDATIAACGLPTPEPGVDASSLPPELVVDDAEVVKVQATKQRISAALNIARSVNEAFSLYRRAARAADFEVVGVDNEGFEAEVYVKKGRDVGAIQIRTSTCDDASVVFVNIVRT